MTAKVYGSDGGRLVLKSCATKCLHYYLYYLDKEFGFMFVKIQTWFPFNIQVYINGRELMKAVLNIFGQGYYWCVNQCEYATDVMFKERSFLEDIHPSLVGHAFYDFTCTDVFTFMGRKPDPRF